MRAALAGQVGEEAQSFSSWLCFLRFFDQKLIRIDAAAFGVENLIVAKLIAKPLERSARREHAAEDAPLAGDRMAHRVNATFGIARGLIRMRKDDAACTEC